MKIKHLLRYLLFMFTTITTAQVIYITLIATTRNLSTPVSYHDLQTILLTSFTGVLPTFIFFFIEKPPRKIYFLLIVPLHFILTLTFVLTTLHIRGGIISDDLIYPVLLFLILYIGFHIRAEIINKRAIEELNKRINATHQP